MAVRELFERTHFRKREAKAMTSVGDAAIGQATAFAARQVKAVQDASRRVA
jgi:hypothetical protein